MLWTSSAWAEKAQFGYDLSLSGSLSLLQSGGSSMSTNALPGDLVYKQNNPWLKLTNNSKDATLDKFVVSVGDDAYHFSQFTIGNRVGTFDIDASIIDGGTNLELTLANFNPGETVYVQFQLRPDDANFYQYPDFSHVLFNSNGLSTDDNSLLTAVFNDPVTKQDDTLTGQLPNFTATNGGSLTSSCPLCTCYPNGGGGTIFAYAFSQQGNLSPPAVPEPAGWVLLLLGGSAIVACGYARRGTSRLKESRTIVLNCSRTVQKRSPVSWICDLDPMRTMNNPN
jgi:hypothetical protein